jgi:hypothetical protein
MSNVECKCKTPNYNAFTGRCMTCGGFHKKDLEMQFDYKSRDWEKEQNNPVCVACLNESRTHQIPGEHEHICGKQTPNTQLPAEWLNEVKQKAAAYTKDYDSRSFHQDIYNAHEAGATEYATKLYAADKANSALEEKNRGLSEENKEWKVECERLAKVADFWQKEYYKLNPPRQPMKIDNNPIA